MPTKRHKCLERRIRERMASDDLQAAAEVALRGYGPEILGFLHRVIDDEADASEIFSQFCEDLWRGLEGFRGQSSFRTWAYTLAVHARQRVLGDPYRRRGRRLETPELQKLEQQVRDETPRYLQSRVKDRFAKIRQQLDPEERQMLILRLDRELTWRQIAAILSGGDGKLPREALDARAAALRQRFRRLKMRIRDFFRREGLL